MSRAARVRELLKARAEESLETQAARDAVCYLASQLLHNRGQALLAWLREAKSRDVTTNEHRVQRLVDVGLAEWMPDRVMVVGGIRVKRKHARALPVPR